MAKVITLKGKIVEDFQLTSGKLSYLLQKNIDEKEALRKFATKITIVPETVRVYSPIVEKK